MAKISLLLLGVLVVCALAIVAAQNKTRRLFSELEREQERSRQLEVEYGQLQLEASTWGLHARVERLATGQLGLRAPDPSRIRVVPVRGAAPAAAEGAR
jgi:cell division protein FtsL